MNRADDCPRNCPGRRVGCQSRCERYLERRRKALDRYRQNLEARRIDEVRYSGSPKK